MPLFGVVSHVSSLRAPWIDTVLPASTKRPSAQEMWCCGRPSGMLGHTYGLRLYLLRPGRLWPPARLHRKDLS